MILYFNTDGTMELSPKPLYRGRYLIMKLKQYKNNLTDLLFSKLIVSRQSSITEYYSHWNPRISFDSNDSFCINVIITDKVFRWCKVWGPLSSKYYGSPTQCHALLCKTTKPTYFIVVTYDSLI